MKVLEESYGDPIVERISRTEVARTVRRMESRMEANPFADVWKQVTGSSLSYYSNCRYRTDILIDEAQILYGKVNSFLRGIKAVVDHSNARIRVLLSMRSDLPPGGDHYPPLDFPTSLGLDWFCLKRKEFDRLVETFINFVYTADDFELTIPTNVRDMIFKYYCWTSPDCQNDSGYSESSFQTYLLHGFQYA